MADRPKFRHNCKKAVFLGNYEGDDLYYQQGQVIARFGNEPGDYLMAGSLLAQGVYTLKEAVRRAESRGLKMDTGERPVVLLFKTSELIVFATTVGVYVDCYRFECERRRDHRIRANKDGTIQEKGTLSSLWKTTIKEFLQKYPNDLGEIWNVEQGGGKIPENEMVN